MYDPPNTAASERLRSEELLRLFRQQWLTGVRPEITAYLQGVEAGALESHVAHLVEIDWRERMRRGEAPRLEDYLKQLPEHIPVLQSICSRLVESEGITEQPTAAASMAPPRDLADGLVAGMHIGRFELRHELGRGGFGVVWEAYDPELTRPVAIKIVRRGSDADPTRTAALHNEARKIARLSHEGILEIYDIVREDDRVCIVTEFMPGGSLAHQLAVYKGRPLEAASLIARVADALHFAHLHGVVHRDVKPHNILLDQQGQAKLADFGLAATEAEQLQEGRSSFGTVGYMAPEVAQGGGQYADARSDIYGLGMVLYQLLTQRLPYLAQTPEQYVRQSLERPPRSPRTIDDQIPVELEQVVLKCLARAPEDRYTTAKDVADQLRLIVSHWQWHSDRHSPAALLAHTTPLPAPSSGSSPRLVITPQPWLSAPTSGSGLTAAHEGSTASGPARPAGRGMLRLVAGALAVALLCVGFVALDRVVLRPAANQDQERKASQEVEETKQFAGDDRGPKTLLSDATPTPRPNQSDRAELDGVDLVRGEWVDVLHRAPKYLLNMSSARDVILNHDAQARSIRVSSDRMTLLELGRTDVPSLAMQFTVTQPAWEGGVGIFFGYHDSEEFGPAVKRFQALTIRAEVAGQQKQLQPTQEFFAMEEFGSFREKSNMPIGNPADVPFRPLLVDVRIVNRELSVRIGADREWSRPERPARMVEPTDFQGRFGLVIDKASATIQNVRVMIPPEKDNP